jgi:hypothetical protein
MILIGESFLIIQTSLINDLGLMSHKIVLGTRSFTAFRMTKEKNMTSETIVEREKAK